MQLKGARFSVRFLGCRVNGAEAEALVSALQQEGALEDHSCFDLAIVVTCGVTAMADRKSRQVVSQLRRACPQACILATGCWAQEADEEQARALGVDLLVGNRQKGRIIQVLKDWDGGFQEHRGELGGLWDPLQAYGSAHHSRALVKVQDGCDLRCSYCIVPTLRGPSVSRPLDDILAESARFIDNGCSELVLTGVHLGLWGRDLGLDLPRLVDEVSALPGLKRLRFGSLEPFGVTDALLEALSHSKAFAPHLHLPLQSGSDRVLREMRRPGTSQDFLNLARRAREALGDDLHLSTDVMVAFPGEEEEDFQATLDLLLQARVGRVHGFIFSPRPGTKAATASKQVPKAEAQGRLRRLLHQSDKALSREAMRWVGRPNTVFIEREGREVKGHNEAWLEVVFEPETPRGQWVTVKPKAEKKGRLFVKP